jgi:hypothetical protein
VIPAVEPAVDENVVAKERVRLNKDTVTDGDIATGEQRWAPPTYRRAQHPVSRARSSSRAGTGRFVDRHGRDARVPGSA